MLRLISWFLLVVLGLSGSCLSERQRVAPQYTPFLLEQNPGVDSLLQTLSQEAKIGQLLIWNLHTPDSASLDQLLFFAGNKRLSGAILNGLSLEKFLLFSDSLRLLSTIPPFIGTQEKSVLNNQFEGMPEQAGALTLSAIRADSVRDRMQTYLLDQVQSLGINLRMGPSIPMASALSRRERAKAEIAALNELHLLSLADPLQELPLGLPDSLLAQQEDVKLYRELVEAGVSGLNGDSAFFARALPEPLSNQLLRYYLQYYLNFEGLISARVAPGPMLDRAIRAGTDLFIVEGSIAEAYGQIQLALEEGRLRQEELDARVRKVLLAKSWMREGLNFNRRRPALRVVQAALAGLNENPEIRQPEDLGILKSHFTSPAWRLMHERLHEEALTVPANVHGLLPLSRLPKNRLLVLEYSAQPFSVFRKTLSRYAEAEYKTLIPGEPIPNLQLEEKEDRLAVFLLDEYSLHPARDSALIDSLRRLGAARQLVLVNFRDPANLAPFDSTLTILQLYDRHDLNEQLAAEALVGARPVLGRLPFSVNGFFCEGQGESNPRTRLPQSSPEMVGIAPERLVSIDAIARTAIGDEIMPGCQIVVAKNGRIIYQKEFGTHTYKTDQPVRPGDIYDVASVTKVAATTLGIMKLYEEEKLELKDRLQELLPPTKGKAVGAIPVKDLLTHQSGLAPNPPILPYLLARGKRNANCRGFFCKYQRRHYSVEVANRFYFDQRQSNAIWNKIYAMPRARQGRFRYSDVNFLLLQKVLEAKADTSLDGYVNKNFFQPLGLRHTTFLPLQKFAPEQIAPTQQDELWRRQLLRGYVHDESAALLGGVAGNAGLFSNAADMAVLFQMLLEGGSYGGQQYFSPETVAYFTKNQAGTHRALGFDKPYRSNEKSMAASASPATFGHTGFTGACVWVDPREELVFVFLANRIHPNPKNARISSREVRRRIHQVVYDARGTFQDTIPLIGKERVALR